MTSDLKGKEHIAKVLIENGAAVNARRNDGTTALHQSILKGIHCSNEKINESPKWN